MELKNIPKRLGNVLNTYPALCTVVMSGFITIACVELYFWYTQGIGWGIATLQGALVGYFLWCGMVMIATNLLTFYWSLEYCLLEAFSSEITGDPYYTPVPFLVLWGFIFDGFVTFVMQIVYWCIVKPIQLVVRYLFIRPACYLFGIHPEKREQPYEK